jgi:hypothetical protein
MLELEHRITAISENCCTQYASEIGESLVAQPTKGKQEA